jgi:multiple sugar transport system substrate-binding protein
MLTRREFTLLAGTLIAAPAAVLEACGGSGSSSTQAAPAPMSTAAADMQMVWWGNADRAKRTTNVINLFQQKNSQYKISGQYTAFTNYFDKLNTQVASGSPPDLIQMDMRHLPTYAAKQVLLDLTRYTPSPLDIGDYDRLLLNQVQTKSGLFGLPVAGNLFAMIRNTSLLQRAGTDAPKVGITWDLFAQYCLDLAKALPKGAWPVDDHSGTIAPFEVWIRSRGHELYTTDGKLGYQRQDVLDWFTYWNDLRRAGGAVPPDVSAAAANNPSQSASVIATGKAVFYMTHSNFLEQYAPLTKDTLGIGPYPQGKRVGLYPKVSLLLTVAAHTRFPSQAAQFLNYWSNNADAAKALAVERGAPGTLKPRAIVKPMLTPEQAAELAYVEQFSKNLVPRTVPDPPGAGDVEQALSRASQSIGLGGTSVGAATDKYLQDAQKALA